MAFELIKVSELPELTTPSDPNVIPIQDGDYLKRISFENLKEAVTGEVADDLAAEVTARGNADTAILADLASPYSASATYAVGDYCTKDGQLYRCTTAISTAEAWTAAHWSAVALGDDTRDLRSALSYMQDATGIYTITIPYMLASGYQYLPFTIEAGTYLFSNTGDGSELSVAAQLFNDNNQRVIDISVGAVNVEKTITSEQAQAITKVVTRHTTLSYKPKSNVLDQIQALETNGTIVSSGTVSVSTSGGKSIVATFDANAGDVLSFDISYYGLNTNYFLIRYKDTSDVYKEIKKVYRHCSGRYLFVVPETITGVSFYVTVNKQVTNQPFSYTIKKYDNGYGGQAISENIAEKSKGIVSMNNDVLTYVNAGCKNAINASGTRNKDRQLGVLVFADVHGSQRQTERAVEYLRETEALDFFVNLGDTAGSYYNDTDGTWYSDIVNTSEKPIYTILGNHDVWTQSLDTSVAPTLTDVYNKWIAPTTDKMEGYGESTLPYYSLQDDTHKLYFIFWNDYGITNNTIVDGSYKYRRDLICFSQDQINWLITQLNGIPTGYHLVFVRHATCGATTVVDTVWSDANAATGAIASPYDYNIIPDIINAWVNGSTLTQAYAPSTSYSDFDTLSVNADFTARGNGIFVCYLCGHAHRDYVVTIDAYPSQKAIGFASDSYDNYNNYGSDLPRENDTKSMDAISVFSVDTTNREISLVRVGSNITIEFVNRTCDKISY